MVGFDVGVWEVLLVYFSVWLVGGIKCDLVGGLSFFELIVCCVFNYDIKICVGFKLIIFMEKWSVRLNMRFEIWGKVYLVRWICILSRCL